MSENYLSECYVLLLLDVRVVYQWDSAQVLTDPSASQEVTAAMVAWLSNNAALDLPNRATKLQ